MQRSTLIATGIGSGKTECFLDPILEHCQQKKTMGCQGIKAILLSHERPCHRPGWENCVFIAETPVLADIHIALYIGGQAAERAAGGTLIVGREALRKELPDHRISS